MPGLPQVFRSFDDAHGVEQCGGDAVPAGQSRAASKDEDLDIPAFLRRSR